MGDNTIGHEPFLVCIWRMQCTEHRTLHHWYSGMGYMPETEIEEKKFWDAIKKVAPPEKRLHFSMKKHGYKELCKFLNVSGNPICEKSGTLTKSNINVLNHEREQPLQNKIFVPAYYLLLHVMSYKLLWGTFSAVFSCLCQPCFGIRKLSLGEAKLKTS